MAANAGEVRPELLPTIHEGSSPAALGRVMGSGCGIESSSESLSSEHELRIVSRAGTSFINCVSDVFGRPLLPESSLSLSCPMLIGTRNSELLVDGAKDVVEERKWKYNQSRELPPH
jgi:hypothetical protein